MEDSMEEMRRIHRTSAIIGIGVVVFLFILLVAEEIIRARLKPFLGLAAIPDLGRLRYLFYGLAVLEVVLIRVLQGLLLRRSPGDTFKTTLQKLFRTALVTVCLSEVPGVLGFLLFVLGGFNRDFYALLGVSVILVFMYFPRLRSWRDWIERTV
jgi:hypothetical protein